MIFINQYALLLNIGNENKQCGCYHFTYTVLAVRMEVVLYGRTNYDNDHILTFLRFSRNDYYSICLDYCNSSNFEQIIKSTTFALPSFVVFYHIIYMVAHISVALIFYYYYTFIFLFCQMVFILFKLFYNKITPNCIFSYSLCTW